MQFSDLSLLAAVLKEQAQTRIAIQLTDAYIFAHYLPPFATVKAVGKSWSAVSDGIEGVKVVLARIGV